MQGRSKFLLPILCLPFLLGAADPQFVRWKAGDPFPPILIDDPGQPLPPLVLVNGSTDIPAMCEPNGSSRYGKSFDRCVKQKAAEYERYEASWYSAHAKRKAELEASRRLAAQERAAIDAERHAAHQEWLRQKQAEEAEAARLEFERQELQRQREIEAHRKADEKAELRMQAAAAEREKSEAATRAACGADYKSIRIGTTINRVQKCVGPFKLVGQMHRADGVLVDSYQHCRGYRCTYLTVIDGTVAAWSN